MKISLARQRQAGFFSVRFKSSGGRLTNAQVLALYELSEKIGAGYIHLTSRQEISIPFVRKEDLETIEAFCAANDLQISPVGTVFKIVTACQGNEVCPRGLIDSPSLARKIDSRHGGRELPCKITCAVTGCPNNCMKVDHNDLGIMGVVEPQFIGERCIYCGACARICPVGAIEVGRAEKSWTINRGKCINCGRCVSVCGKAALEAEVGYKIFFGGRNLLPIVRDEEEVCKLLDAATEYFNANARKRERFRKMLERLGTADFLKQIATPASNY